MPEGAGRKSGREVGLPRRSPVLFKLFSLYLRWYFYRSFRAGLIARDGLPRELAGRPLIIYSNHPSWWDPAIYILLARRLFANWAAYGPIDSESLKKYGLLEAMGVFPVPQDDRRGGAVFLRTCLAVLTRPGAMLMITAEGRFTDPRGRPISLRPGLAHLARRVPDAVILPLAIEYCFWNERRPEVLLRFGAPVAAPAGGSVAEWHDCLEAALTATMDALAAQSMARDPKLFVPLLRGAIGVGGVYDVWRRVLAWRAGRRFDASHEGTL